MQAVQDRSWWSRHCRGSDGAAHAITAGAATAAGVPADGLIVNKRAVVRRDGRRAEVAEDRAATRVPAIANYSPIARDGLVVGERAVADCDRGAIGLAKDGATSARLPLGTVAAVATPGLVVAQRAADQMSRRTEGVAQGGPWPCPPSTPNSPGPPTAQLPVKVLSEMVTVDVWESPGAPFSMAPPAADPVEEGTTAAEESTDGPVAGGRTRR